MLVATPYSERPPRYTYELTSTGRELAGALRLLEDWGSRRLGGAAQAPRHEECGTPLEVRWYCPSLPAAGGIALPLGRGRALLRLAVIAREQLHEQAVVPALAAEVALVAAHDAHAAEADLLVAADRGRVLGRGIDRDPVMATLVDQAGERRVASPRFRDPGRGAQDRGRCRSPRDDTSARAPPSSRSAPRRVRPTSIVCRVHSGSSQGNPSAGASHQRITAGVV